MNRGRRKDPGWKMRRADTMKTTLVCRTRRVSQSEKRSPNNEDEAFLAICMHHLFQLSYLDLFKGRQCMLITFLLAACPAVASL